MRRTLFWISLWLVVISLIVAPATALAQTNSVVWTRYDVDITVRPDGDLRVVETQEIKFDGGPFTNGFAVIPLERTDGIAEVTVSEPGQLYSNFSGGGDYTYSVSDAGNELSIDWYFPPTSNQSRVFELAYTVHGAIRRYEDGDIIQYKAIDDQFEFPVFGSTVTLHLPPGGPLVTDPESAGALMEWETSPDSLTATYKSVGTIQPYEGVEIGIAFQHGAVSGPPPSWQAEFDRQANYEETVKPLIDTGLCLVGLVLLLALPGALYLIWYLFGRDPNPGLVLDYIAEPPSDLPSGMVGMLVDEKTDLRDLTATLIDFARRGFVTIEGQEVPGAFGSTSSSFVLKKNGEPGKLRSYEEALYNAVFAGQEQRDLSKLPEGFFAKLPGINSRLYSETVSAGLFKAHPESVRNNYLLGGIFLALFSLFIGFVAMIAGADLSTAVVCPFVPVVMFGAGLAVLSRAMPAKTRKGAAEAAKWVAFQKYLANIQKYRDVAGMADQFEKYLPYAVAFGLERRWVTAFAKAPNIVVPLPRWYHYRPRATGQPARGVGDVAPTAPGGQMPGLNQAGEGMIGGLNTMGEGLISALNTAGRGFSTPPRTYTYSGGGSRGYSGGSRSFRSSGFRSGGSSGGGRRGFR